MMTTDRSLIPLDALVEDQVYGGKAARLSAALRAGLPVPTGFVLHPSLVVRVAKKNLSITERAALEQHLAKFGTAAVAVRSSAIGEDGTMASFAGQHISFLNVHGLEKVLSAIEAVWNSGQAEPAQNYRKKMGIVGEPQMAVIVQGMVSADVAGVLFTVDPVSGSGKRWIVEAAWGLGEAVVGGLVSPDHYIISRNGKLLECHLGLKKVAVVASEGGGTSEIVLDNPVQVKGACLDQEKLSQISDLGTTCERLFGVGQDIEWAFSGRVLYLLQSRPVTSLGGEKFIIARER